MQAKKVLGSLYLTIFGLTLAANAHPGHSSLPLPSDSIAHYAFEPMHVLPALFAGAILCVAIRWIFSCRWRGVARK